MQKIRSSEITPEHVYVSRRRFMKGAMKLAVGSALLAACGGATPEAARPTPTTAPGDGTTPVTASGEDSAGGDADELGNALTPYEAVINYNNFYEFSLSKELVAELAADYPTSPWEVTVGGLVHNPRTFDLDDLRAFETEERIYRMRCVEAWSMVIPWVGFPLARLLEAVEPTSEARFVRFQSAYDPDKMPGTSQSFPWPYVEGLRLDEAMHDLTLMATGIYGKDLLPQNGAPVRLVVPWKYGLKSLKSIVKIDLVAEQPATFWDSQSSEYGFWSIVNPEVSHPRWSQATERLIGENRRQETLFFNGYAEEVAHLYDNLDDRDLYY
jgi:sulfoxide reductase catalytic subunit YedY